MIRTLYIDPLDLQRAVAFTATDNGRSVIQNIQIEYRPAIADEHYPTKLTMGKSVLRATDSYRMVEIETGIDYHVDAPDESGMWFIHRHDALTAIAEARIKKLPLIACKVNDSHREKFPRVSELWEKPTQNVEKVSFNSKLITDSIKALKCQNVRLEFAGSNERVLISPEDSRIRALIMPIRTEV